MLATLSILLTSMAPFYTEQPNEYKKRSRFILIPLHFLYLWVIVIAIVTASGGFCTDQEMFPNVIYLANGLFILIFIIIVGLSLVKY